MVPPSGESLNALFEELERWEHHLKHADIDFRGLEL